MWFIADKLNIIVCVIVIYICIYNAFTKYKWEYDRKRGALAGSANAAPILEVEENVADNQTISAPPGSEEYIRQKKNVEGSSQSRVSKQVASAKQAGQVKKGQTIYKIQILTSIKTFSRLLNCLKEYKECRLLYWERYLQVYIWRDDKFRYYPQVAPASSERF